MSKLFEPYALQSISLKNRVVMAPMCMYSAQDDGMVTPFHLVHYATRAAGQVGLIILEATGVVPEGRISNKDLGIWDDAHIEGLSQLVEGMKAYGAKTGIQLAHAGRKATVDGEIFAPSAIAFSSDYKTPIEMTEEDILYVIEAFKQAAVRATKAGFDVLEIHGAHGYLISEFLSPATNKRQDQYGGSQENRYRILRQVIDAIRSVWDGPLLVRVSAEDYAEDGTTMEDFIVFSRWMKSQGVDLVDVSTGGVVPAAIHVFPGYQVSHAEAIKHGANIPTGAVGLITTAVQAEEILQNNRADLIFLARVLLRDPYWPLHAAKELGEEVQPPVQYVRGW
ncbi:MULTISPECIES: NADPH dehydrogenase NamA [Lysinibacillus]|uniref:NADPH dehydrogenase NamA n=1 Tax=Lysinibacillus TaxID=400634 RepID=UPI0007388946|nr:MULTISPECIES: NADPH dehydrogenase NamA [unclassified Lysinibacillus]MEE3806176.1 NADPH dehydrogenase NamA [Lysinibacillus fusiformis]KUF31974.1 NADPH dehydrogenase [Lysinibacillus sp. F5]WCH46080.1 NADPH dehydrogenase NamA [Lysinibacillus sp. OF-1]SCZ07242.1 NADPH2 dehydrogenase [Lysinibacillus sp. SG9]SDB51745.1 NADPH2 dehydrogenase [Lysinibacillus sp. TC-37]